MDTATGLSLLSNNPKLFSLLESRFLIAKPQRQAARMLPRRYWASWRARGLDGLQREGENDKMEIT
jgi:hypothetical protein